jgi:hypothetical protein
MLKACCRSRILPRNIAPCLVVHLAGLPVNGQIGSKYGGDTFLKLPAKKLLPMKLFPNFYVFIYEARAKLYAAEKHHVH